MNTTPTLITVVFEMPPFENSLSSSTDILIPLVELE